MFGKLEELRQRPIPDLTEERGARVGYRNHPIDKNDPRYQEGVVDLRSIGIAGKNYYYRVDNPPYNERIRGSIPGLYVRTSVVSRLQRMNELLAPNFEVFVHDAWRSQELQRYFHDVWYPTYLRGLHPDWTDEQILIGTEQVWARGALREELIDPESPSPHSTASAVDYGILVKASGKLLPLGVPHDMGGERAYPDYLEFHSDGSFSDEEGKLNRRLQYWVSEEAGLVVNPNEIWHGSDGDQLSAKIRQFRCKRPAVAHYGPARPQL